jgi:hypothetical protein
MKKLWTKFILSSAACILAGCAQEPPKCSDEQTLTTAKRLIAEIVSNVDALRANSVEDILAHIRLDVPRATAYDEKIKRYSCTAKVIAADMYEVPFTYESQLDDNKDHIVAVGGFGSGDLFSMQGAVLTALHKVKSAEANTAVVPKALIESSPPEETTREASSTVEATPTPAETDAQETPCVADKMKGWDGERKRDLEVATANSGGEEVRVSAGMEAYQREEVLAQARLECR